MTYRLLLGGYRSTIALITFEASPSKIKLVSESPAPKNASWIQPAVSHASKGDKGAQILYSLSEEEKGFAFGIELKDDKVEVTQQRETNGGPAHGKFGLHQLKDGSGVVVANYLGGSAIFFPTTASGALAAESQSPNLHFPFPYEGKSKPNEERQDTPHPHQIVEGENGVLYVPDLGSDRVWLVKRDGDSGLKIEGYLQAPAGSGPRHAVLSIDGKHLYTLTELGHTVLAWTLDGSAASTHPLPDFEASIAPPSVPPTHSKYIDSAELALHPKYPNTLFASNRLELQIFDKQPDLPKLPDYPPSGDAIAIIRLEGSDRKIKDIKHVRTGCNNVRGMTLSPDGKYVALAGQDGGGVEVWEISGEDGDQWKLAAKDESIEKVTTLVWV
ncbi:Lactonase, 7-bladed beta-propeller-domain-containing protein [Papiliotrema laurentii]|uniref:Lactonase, 7-bladed beta-propeller-domain-containing protein n=1 Tax=Papiliotrema laurentii TaxID=5418 RepID=A0AAD9FVJ5_PAPLA|nr:Lactonase, 7-bladed beta-propeller-domain-containing protein [Papiliotrema laurentii]